MHGPFPPGRLTARLQPRPFQHLEPGRWYEVIAPFTDHDRVEHAKGESWRFLGYNFVPYDDGLSLFVSLDGEQEWQIRLQWRPEEQAAIIDALAQHLRLQGVAPLDPPPGFA
jgi:hypothetical protein